MSFSLPHRPSTGCLPKCTWKKQLLLCIRLHSSQFTALLSSPKKTLSLSPRHCRHHRLCQIFGEMFKSDMSKPKPEGSKYVASSCSLSFRRARKSPSGRAIVTIKRLDGTCSSKKKLPCGFCKVCQPFESRLRHSRHSSISLPGGDAINARVITDLYN